MGAAFFDLDKTVIARSSVLAFGRHFRREGLLSRATVVRGLYAQVVYMLVGADEEKMERMREAMLALTRGWERDRVAAVVRETLEETVTPLVYAEVLDLFAEHRREGRKIFIVSSSPIEIVEPIAEHLDVDEAIATRAAVDDDGRYTGDLEFYAYGSHKATALREVASRDGFDLAECYAYSDSITDLPMLEAVGHPFAVNPDRELAAAARERGWEILEFRNPVSLRDRLPAPPSAPTVAVGGGAALAAAALVAVWLLRRRSAPPSRVDRVRMAGERVVAGVVERVR